MPKESKVALLIDCDNVSHKSIEGVIDELSKYGKVNIRHAYGNWKNESMKGWEEKLHPHAIKPILKSYKSGKSGVKCRESVRKREMSSEDATARN